MISNSPKNEGINMNQEVEIEYKNLLTKSEFDHLLIQYPFPEKANIQTNYYLETTDFLLKEKGCALRIRESNNRYVLTLKEPHEYGLLETHDTLTEEEMHRILHDDTLVNKDVSNRLYALDVPLSSLHYFGKLTTKRKETKFDHALLVLDHSIYNNTDDYELEVEAPTESIGIQVFEQLLQKQGIQKRITPNKIERFFTSLPS